MLEKLREHWINASEDNIHAGMRWYKEAHIKAAKLSKTLDIPLYKVVGVIAALSPRNKWERNLLDASSVLRKGNKAIVATFNSNKDKALRILKSNSEEEVLEILKSPKTQSFFRNIMHPLKSTSVTVDVWAFRSVGLEPKNKYYLEIQNAYIILSKEIGILPHELQAIIWTKVRGK